MSKLVIMRHAESILGHQKKFSGIMDIPLSEIGIKQAINSASFLPDIQFDIVYTSTLMRSLQTALIFLTYRNLKRIPIRILEKDLEQYLGKKLYIPIIEKKELQERNYGVFEGRTKKEIDAQYEEKLVSKWRRSLNQGPPEGESLKELLDKLKPFLENELKHQLNQGHNIILVAHQSSIRALYYLMFHPSETEIEMIEFESSEILSINYENEVFQLIETHETISDSTIEED